MKQFAVNSAGVIGYMFLLLGWLWTIMLVLSIDQVTDLLTPAQTQTESTAVAYFPEFTLPEPITLIIMGAIVVLMIGISIYALIKVPIEIIKRSSQATHKAASRLTPAMHQSRPVSKKKRLRLTARLILYIKLALLVSPVAIVLCLVLLTENALDLESDITIIISAGASFISALFFFGQYMLAKILKVPLQKLL